MKESTFQFNGYKISKFECQISEDIGTENINLNQHILIGHKISKEDDRSARVMVRATISSPDDNFNLVCEINGKFKECSGVTDHEFESLCSRNAPAILYPILRSVILSHTALAGIPPIILPIVDLRKAGRVSPSTIKDTEQILDQDDEKR